MSEQTLSLFVVALISFLLGVTRLTKGTKSLVFLVGFAVPLVAMLGARAVLLVLVASLLLALPRGVSYFYPAFSCWLIALGLPTILASLNEIGFSMPLSRLLLMQLSLWIVALAWLGVFYLQPILREAAIRGTVYSVFLVAVVFVYQKISPESLTMFPNSSSFWRGIGRVPATLSDPNSLGIWSLIGLHLALGCSEVWFRRFGAVCFFCLGLSSGSRSFVLGIVASLLVFFGLSRRTIAVTVGGMLLLIGVALQPELYQLMPSSVIRVFESIADLSVGLQSRAIFFFLDLKMWIDFPFSGLGLGAYRFELPIYAHRANLLEDGWTDNTNSFYLGLLAEQGLFGLAAIMLPVLRFRLNWSDRVAVSGILSFLVVLIFGPHLDFAEVTFAFVILTASGVRLVPASGLWRFAVIVTAGVTILIVPLQFLSRTYGFSYPKRNESSLLSMRSGRRAQLTIPCNAGQCEFELAAPRNSSGQVVQVTLSPSNREGFKLLLTGSERRSVVLPASLRQSSLVIGLQTEVAGVAVRYAIK